MTNDANTTTNTIAPRTSCDCFPNGQPPAPTPDELKRLGLAVREAKEKLREAKEKLRGALDDSAYAKRLTDPCACCMDPCDFMCPTCTALDEATAETGEEPAFTYRFVGLVEAEDLPF